jgi:anti-sigma factor RsiW
MAIEQKYSDLINADIDGDISVAEKTELEAYLAENAEGKALHDELASQSPRPL